MNEKQKIAFVKRHGWYQNKDNPFNPKAWFNDAYPVGEEFIDDVIEIIKEDKVEDTPVQVLVGDEE